MCDGSIGIQSHSNCSHPFPQQFCSSESALREYPDADTGFMYKNAHVSIIHGSYKFGNYQNIHPMRMKRLHRSKEQNIEQLSYIMFLKNT